MPYKYIDDTLKALTTNIIWETQLNMKSNKEYYIQKVGKHEKAAKAELNTALPQRNQIYLGFCPPTSLDNTITQG